MLLCRTQTALPGSQHRVKAEREMRRTLIEPSKQSAHFAPEARVQQNIREFKAFLRDNVEVHASERKVRMRPHTASLMKHKELWNTQELSANINSRGVGTSAWRSTFRDLEKFAKDNGLEQSKKTAAMQKTSSMFLARGSLVASKLVEALSHHRQASRPSSAVLGIAPLPSDSTLLKFIAGYTSLASEARSLPRIVFRNLHTKLLQPPSGDFGVESTRFLRRKQFHERIADLKLPRLKADAIFSAMDLNHDNTVSHRPLLAAMRCVDDSHPLNWIAFVFTCLASTNASLHIAEYHAAHRVLIQEIIADGQESVSLRTGSVRLAQPSLPVNADDQESPTRCYRSSRSKWHMRCSPPVVEFEALAAMCFGTQEVAQWRGIRSAVMESCPALTELLMQRGL